MGVSLLLLKAAIRRKKRRKEDEGQRNKCTLAAFQFLDDLSFKGEPDLFSLRGRQSSISQNSICPF